MKEISSKLLIILITFSFFSCVPNVINPSNPIIVAEPRGPILIPGTMTNITTNTITNIITNSMTNIITNNMTNIMTNTVTNAGSSYLRRTFTMAPSSYGSRATVTFTSETQIDITRLYINSPPDALFYLGYGGSGGDYVDRGEEISGVFRNKNNDSLTLIISSPLNQLDYTHIAIICRQFRVIINEGIKYR